MSSESKGTLKLRQQLVLSMPFPKSAVIAELAISTADQTLWNSGARTKGDVALMQFINVHYQVDMSCTNECTFKRLLFINRGVISQCLKSLKLFLNSA